jgi:hypothetical protein
MYFTVQMLAVHALITMGANAFFPGVSAANDQVAREGQMAVLKEGTLGNGPSSEEFLELSATVKLLDSKYTTLQTEMRCLQLQGKGGDAGIAIIDGTTWYAEHSGAFAHFLTGFLLPVFSALHEANRTLPLRRLVLNNPGKRHRKWFIPFMQGFIAEKVDIVSLNLSACPTAEVITLSFKDFHTCGRASAAWAAFVRRRVNAKPRSQRQLNVMLMRRLGSHRSVENW